MCAQRNKVECMLTSICCHNRFGFFLFCWGPCPPSFGRALQLHGAAKCLVVCGGVSRSIHERRHFLYIFDEKLREVWTSSNTVSSSSTEG